MRLLNDAMKTYTKIQKKRWLKSYALFMALIAFGIILIPWATDLEQERRWPVILVGGLVWGGLLGAMIITLQIGSARRGDPSFKNRGSWLKYWGLTHFGKNGLALIADVGMFVFLIVFIILERCTYAKNAIFLFLGMFIFAFGMHCMLNSLNYLYINQKEKKEGTHHETNNEIQ